MTRGRDLGPKRGSDNSDDVAGGESAGPEKREENEGVEQVQLREKNDHVGSFPAGLCKELESAHAYEPDNERNVLKTTHT